MRFNVFNQLGLTCGQIARVLAYVLVAFSSGALGLLAVFHLEKGTVLGTLGWYQIWVMLAAAIGGVLALFLAKERIGQSGVSGWVRGAAGGIWVTTIGALIGGTLALPLYGTMFGPFIVLVTLIGTPILLAIWVCHLAALHMLMRTYQRERDSIFAPLKRRPKDPFKRLAARIASPLADR